MFKLILITSAKLIKNIADLVKLKRIDGITDLRDESDREGMRIVIELRRDANPNIPKPAIPNITSLLTPT